MEKRINKKIETYLVTFKNDIKNKITDLDFDEKMKTNELLEFIFDYDRLLLLKDDFIKRKRVHNIIPTDNRCIAKKSCSEQCTRRRKEGSEYCGTHTKYTPNGTLSFDGTQGKKSVEVIAKEIDGIVYYVDEFKNVYKTEDILNEKENPQIIAKYENLQDNTCVLRYSSI